VAGRGSVGGEPDVVVEVKPDSRRPGAVGTAVRRWTWIAPAAYLCLGTVLGVNSKLTRVPREAIVIPATTRVPAAQTIATPQTAINRLVIAPRIVPVTGARVAGVATATAA
jgi:hypothetical protein